MEKVFVIIVTYNGSRWVRKCLDSLRSSTISLTPVIIDNCSTDETLTIIKEQYPEVALIESKINLGFGRANNLGITYGLERGADYFFLLNQDAWVSPDAIEILIERNKKYPEYFVLSPLHLDGTGKKLDYNFSLWISPSECPGLVSDLVLQNNIGKEVFPARFVNAALWLISRECVLTVGGFDPIFSHYGEDNDYTSRVRYSGFKVGICPDAVGFHDRKQIPLELDKLPKGTRFNRRFNAHLITLKDNDKPLAFCILKTAGEIIKRCTKHAIKRKPADMLIEVKVVGSILRNINKVRLHRKVAKYRGASFLEA